MGQIAPSCFPERIHPSHIHFLYYVVSFHGKGHAKVPMVWVTDLVQSERECIRERESRGVINMLNSSAGLRGFV